MNITNDIMLSMLSYSKNYQPYVYDWGKRVGRELVKEKLEIDAILSLKAKNILEHGIMAGAIEQLTSKKISAPRMKHSLEYYHILKRKNIPSDSEDSLLKVSYPRIFLSPGSHTLLYWIGKETGSEIGKSHKHEIFSLEKISNKLGIGEVKVIRNKILLKDSAFASDRTGKPMCSYYAGFAAGFLSSSEKRFNVVEIKCAARGDEHCEFILF